MMRTLLVASLLVFISGFTFNAQAALPGKQNYSFKEHIAIAKNPQKPMSLRWKSLIAAADVANNDQLSEVKEFVKSKDWYMRNASLVALNKINVNHALVEARTLLKDKALVVRSAAVDVLASNLTIENRDILANELDKPYNFVKKQSLWIRSKIFGIIASRAKPDDRAFYARYLFDKDPKISQMAAATLEKITDVEFQGSKKVSAWQDYVKKNSWF